MNDILPTIKIKTETGDIAVINASDYDAAKHVLATDTLAPLKPLDPEVTMPIFGSATQPSQWTLPDGKVVLLSTLEIEAHARSGMTVEQWNSLTQDEREKRISDVVSEVIPVELPEFKVGRKRAKNGGFKFFVADKAGKAVSDDFETEELAQEATDSMNGK